MNRHTQQGFTLVETLVAVGILALVVAMVSQGIIGNLRASQETRENAAAKAYAQALLDAYRSVWSNPDNYVKSIEPDEAGLPSLPDNYKIKEPLVNISPVPLTSSSGADITNITNSAGPYPQIKEVKVTVYKGTAVSVTMSTRISDPSKRTKIK